MNERKSGMNENGNVCVSVVFKKEEMVVTKR
jgi:hypothetical protein